MKEIDKKECYRTAKTYIKEGKLTIDRIDKLYNLGCFTAEQFLELDNMLFEKQLEQEEDRHPIDLPVVSYFPLASTFEHLSDYIETNVNDRIKHGLQVTYCYFKEAVLGHPDIIKKLEEKFGGVFYKDYNVLVINHPGVNNEFIGLTTK